MLEAKIIPTVEELWDTVLENIAKRTGTPEIQITSLPKLSHNLFGLKKKEFIVLAGRPSNGKSALSLQIAWDVAKQGFQVYFFSREMSEEALIERLFCNLAMVDNRSMLYRPMEFKDKFDEFRELIKNIKFIITDSIGVNIDNLYQAIEDLPQADMIILDYIQTVRGFGKRREVLDDYIYKFKEICNEKNMVGLMVSQINRGSEQTEGKRPQLYQLKETGCIHGDSIVSGLKIKDIYKKQKFFPVKTYNRRTQKVEFVTPSGIINTGKLHCYKIKTKSGKEIIISKDTKLFAGKWIEVKKLKIGDKIYVDNSK